MMKAFSICDGNSIEKSSAIKYSIVQFLQTDNVKILYDSCFPLNDTLFLYDKNVLIQYLTSCIERGCISDDNKRLIILSYDNKIIGFTTYCNSFENLRKIFEQAMTITNNNMDQFVYSINDDMELSSEFKGVINEKKYAYPML